MISVNDIVCLKETWCNNNPVSFVTRCLPDCDVIHSPATKTASKSRAKGGLIIASHKHKYSSQTLFLSEECIIAKFQYENYKFIIALIYVSPSADFTVVLDLLNEQMNLSLQDIPIYIGGDFNSRVGNLNQLSNDLIINNENFSASRVSLDIKKDSKGVKLVSTMETNGYILLNGRSISDSPANYTFVNKNGKSVIDLIWSNIMGFNNIVDFRVIYSVTVSDHFPVAVFIEEKTLESKKKTIPGLKWNDNNSIEYFELMKMCEFRENKNKSINELENGLITAITNNARKLGMIKKERYKGGTSKPWFDNDCINCKKILKDLLKECKICKFKEENLVKTYIDTKKE